MIPIAIGNLDFRHLIDNLIDSNSDWKLNRTWDQHLYI